MNKQIAVVAIVAIAAWSITAQIKVACIGNSITSGTGTATPSYVPRLQTLLGAAYTVQNEGVSGTTLFKRGDKSYWTQGLFGQLFAFQPNIVTIKLGTNDTKPQNWDTHAAEFRQDYEAMIDTLNLLPTKPKIFLVLPVPIWTNTFGIRDSALQKMIPIIKAIGAKRGLWVIDANTPLKSFQSYFADGVHPNVAGSDTIANVIYHCITGAPSSSRFVRRSHTTAQGTLPYRLYYPYKYNPATKYPLILSLHGAGERGIDNQAQIIVHRLAEIWAEDSMQARHSCFVVAPQCPADPAKWVNVAAWTNVFYSTQSMAESNQLVIARSLLDSLIREFPIDTNRQYVTGISMGGYGTWDLIARSPGRFAAAVPMSGGLDTSKVSAMRNMPIWTFHGAVDGTVPPTATQRIMRTLFPNLGVAVTYYTAQYANYFAGSTMTRAALLTAIDGGAKKLYGEYTDGQHDIWTNSYNDTLVARWLFLQRKASVNTISSSGAIANRRATKAVMPVFNGSNVTLLFAGIKSGERCEFRVFDARGVLTGKIFVDASPASQNAVKKILATTAGMRWVTVKKL
jgi:poly(3-hydroxybutyrate) depolymerase/lysophospholipase L1-like esterase